MLSLVLLALHSNSYGFFVLLFEAVRLDSVANFLLFHMSSDSCVLLLRHVIVCPQVGIALHV